MIRTIGKFAFCSCLIGMVIAFSLSVDWFVYSGFLARRLVPVDVENVVFPANLLNLTHYGIAESNSALKIFAYTVANSIIYLLFGFIVGCCYAVGSKHLSKK